jgi:aspartate aminotransferase-like enzyme
VPATDLRIPGPTPLPPQVLEAMQQEMMPHRSERFAVFYSNLLGQVRRIHQTDGDVLILPGSGSAGWEAAIVNTLSPGDQVISVITGDFGERFYRVAKAFRLDVVRVEVEWGQAATADVVSSTLEAHPAARAVLYTYNETSTGVTNPLRQIVPLVRDHGALLLVDAVSAVAGIPLEMDAWGVDLVLSGSQKAWMCPPGLAILAFGPRVWDAYQHADYPRFFWDFGALKTAVDQGSTPATPPLTLLYALKAACDMLESEGMEAVFGRHERLGSLVRDRIERLGYSLFVDRAYASNTVTAAVPPDGLRTTEIVRQMRTRFGIEIAGGQARLKDRIVRIGHMGWVHEPELERTLDALGTVTRGMRG